MGSLTQAGISAAVNAAECFLSRGRAAHESAVRVRLALEDALLFFRERFGEAAEFKLAFRRRFGRLLTRISVRGPAQNPLAAEEGDAAVLARLIRLDDFTPRWTWRDGVNEVEFVAVRRLAISPVQRILLGLALGLGAGWLAAAFPCRTVEAAIAAANRTTGFVLDVLRGAAGPFIFVSVVCSTCAIGNVSLLKRIGSGLFFRAVSVLLGFSVTSVAVARIFCASGQTDGNAGAGRLWELLFGLVPVNLLAPFVEGNIPQILVLAIILGCILLSLGERVRPLVDLAGQTKSVLNVLLQSVLSVFLPILVFCCLFSTLATGRLAVLFSSWKIAALDLGVSSAWCVAAVVVTSIRLCESPLRFLRLSFPVVLTALTTGSSLAAMYGEMDVLKRRFGVRQEYVDFAEPFILPLSLFTYCAELSVMMICMAECQGLVISPGWLATVALVVPLAVLSTPPVPGGSGVVLGLLCAQLGIDASCIGLLVAMEIGLNYMDTWLNSLIRLCLVRSAARAVRRGNMVK